MNEFASVESEQTESLQHVGNFRFLYDGERWEWSDEVAVLHGYRPGEVTPTTELMVRHKHPDDRARFTEMVSEMLTNHAPFSSRHRIIDTQGRVRPVVVIAHTIHDSRGEPIGTEGFYLDLSDSVDKSVRDAVDDHIRRFRETGATIEQAKGMLMVIYGVDAERAIDVLRWRSQQENVKLREVAESVISDAAALHIPDPLRRHFDDIILNGTRVSPNPG
ncbi:PAS and ANTAR domain-containing protein [Gordonia sp. CPCC 206044]|uniref:PAS and ANTAR domain-containing protein n=1 Tax=Gordonia sp. CPCC 206044 TaxID=3140793 RepID=UPI003AF39185